MNKEAGYVLPWEFPNRCIPCRSDDGNWGCDVYRKIMEEKKAKECVVIQMIPQNVPGEYSDIVTA